MHRKVPLLASKIILFFLLFIAFDKTIFAQTKNQRQEQNELKMGDWQTHSTGELQQLRSIAYTTSSGSSLTLMIEFVPPACNYDWHLVFKLPKPNHETGRVTWIQQSKIDSRQPFVSYLYYNQRVGDEYAIFKQAPTNGWVNEMFALEKGSKLSVSLQEQITGKQLGIQQFSLLGYFST